MLTKIIDDPSGMVSKLIFEDKEAIWEAVAYKYKNRGVVCFSVQSGCPVGCSFCGTGRRFVRNLSRKEIDEQVVEALNVIGDKEKIQLMSMSMGEPMENWFPLKKYIVSSPMIMATYHPWGIYVSTVGLDFPSVWEDFFELGKLIRKFGLQISLHHWDDDKRKKLLGNYPFLLPLSELKTIGLQWTNSCGKPCYWNYICRGNETEMDAQKVWKICKGMHVTCSVFCNTSEMKKADPTPAQRFSEMLLSFGEIDVSVFDPAGQDTIGGGCGQLLYVQEKLRGR